MSILNCPECSESFSRYSHLLTHVSSDHLLSGIESHNRTCPECGGEIRNETLHFHLPCLIGLVPDTVSLLRGTVGYLCPICSEPLDGEDHFQKHIRQHTTLEQAAILTDSISCSGCGNPIQSGEQLRDHFLCLYNGISEKERYDCPACERASDDKGAVLWHIWIDHWNEEGLQAECPGCGDQIEVDEIRQHLGCIKEYEPHAVMYLLGLRSKECFFCSHEAFNQKRLAEHVHNDHLDELAPDDQCPSCGVDLNGVSKHKLEHHYPSLALANDLEFDYGKPTAMLTCPGCQNRVDDIDDLFHHIEDEHRALIDRTGECRVCSQSIQKRDHVECIAKLGGRTSSRSKKERYRPDSPPGVSQYPAPKNSIKPQKSIGNQDQTSYYNDLQSFIDLEKEASRDESWRRYRNTPIHRLKYSTELILDLIPMGKQHHPDFETQYIFERPIPDHEEDPESLIDRFGIYPREEVIVGSTKQDSRLPISAVVTFSDDQTIGIAPRPDQKTNWAELHDALTRDNEAYHVVHLLNSRPYDRESNAIQKVSNQPIRSSYLAGGTTLSERQQVVGNVYAGQLNEHQAVAVGRGLGTNDVFCIHGPPGTGKTRTLTALIELAVARGERVLACAHSNPATDNLLVGTSTPENLDEGSLHATVTETDITMARLGHHSENAVVQQDYVGNSLRRADIVGSTTNAAAELDDDEFDLVVVDEATQASQPATFVPWLKGDRLVLAGDHRQLPPYCSDETAKAEDMHISLFEHLLNIYGTEVTERLDIQYRMNEKIGNFTSQAFYDRNLNHGDQNCDWTIADLPPMLGIDIASTEQTRDDTHSKYNETEADLAAKATRQVINKGVKPDNIGIITPYTAQIGVIANALNEANIEDHSNIKIDTIDSFQGSERDVIVVSFVRSNKHNSSGFLAFPDEGQRRLNVAITRAKRRLVLIGDWETLGTVADHSSAENSCAEVYTELKNYLINLNSMSSFN